MGREVTMPFIQIVEFRTSRFEEGQSYIDEYRKATEGKRTATRARVCKDRDQPGHYFTIAEFPSYEDAMRNSQLPETSEMAEQLQRLAEGAPTFYNLEVIREDLT
jgi:hypothetical protein